MSPEDKLNMSLEEQLNMFLVDITSLEVKLNMLLEDIKSLEDNHMSLVDKLTMLLEDIKSLEDNHMLLVDKLNMLVELLNMLLEDKLFILLQPLDINQLEVILHLVDQTLPDKSIPQLPEDLK
jgi:hypothetical protein